MNVLFVHNNFPAQFIRMARAVVSDPSNRVAAIGAQASSEMEGVELRRYRAPEKPSREVHPFARRFEMGVSSRGTGAVRRKRAESLGI